jgi:hypothetical protein
MTPVKRPEGLVPGTVVADTLELALVACDEPVEAEVMAAAGPGKLRGLNGADVTAGVSNGVGGPDEAGEGDSTTHMLRQYQYQWKTKEYKRHYIPVRSSSNKLSYSMSKSGDWVNVKYRK